MHCCFSKMFLVCNRTENALQPGNSGEDETLVQSGKKKRERDVFVINQQCQIRCSQIPVCRFYLFFSLCEQLCETLHLIE